jgi:ferredoxin
VVEILAHVLQTRRRVPERGWTTRTAPRSNLPLPADKPETFGSARRSNPEITDRRPFSETTNPMPTFVYMTKCDGCGYCVDICPSDIMHIDTRTGAPSTSNPTFAGSAIPV